MRRNWIAVVALIFLSCESHFANAANLSHTAPSELIHFSPGSVDGLRGLIDGLMVSFIVMFAVMLLRMKLAHSTHQDRYLVFEKLSPGVQAWEEWDDARVVRIVHGGRGPHILSKKTFKEVIRRHMSAFGVEISEDELMALASLPPTTARADVDTANRILKASVSPTNTASGTVVHERKTVSEADAALAIQDHVEASDLTCSKESMSNIVAFVSSVIGSAGTKFPLSAIDSPKLSAKALNLRRSESMVTGNRDPRTTQFIRPTISDMSLNRVLDQLQAADKRWQQVSVCYYGALEAVINVIEKQTALTATSETSREYYAPIKGASRDGRGMETPSYALRLTRMFEKNGAPMMVILTLAILLAASVKITLLADKSKSSGGRFDSSTCDISRYTPPAPLVMDIFPTGATLSWTPLAPCQIESIVRRLAVKLTDPTGAVKTIEVAPSGSSVQLTGLVPGRTYRVVLEATKDIGPRISGASQFTTRADAVNYSRQ